KVYFEGHDVTRLENVTYTTCAKDQDDVILTAKELTIDQGTGRGVAKNMTLRLEGVPVFYLPAISFPINDERKSGFLFPSFGAQEDSGFVLATPYYWNIAPNYDATITPRIFTNRGLQVAGDFRYLHEKSRGFLYGEYMPDDSEFDDDRGRFWARHNQEFTPRWNGKIDYQTVSDDDYFDDFSNDIQVSATTFLPQVAEVAYDGRVWDFQARAFAYETVDENISSFNEPFDRLPQLRLIGNFRDWPLDIRARLDTELVRFDHDERTDGTRINAIPSVWRMFRNEWGYARPRVSVRHISYDLDNTAEDQDSSPSVTVPIFSFDTGIAFERNATWLGDNFNHTLEPRVFYVYIPEENQDDQPNFDTSDINFNNFGNIFREERFFGGDRVGDTNQVTLGLTSRMIHEETGREWMRGSIGQIFFLEDREVTLFDGAFTDDSGDYLAEAVVTWTPRWSSYGFLQWNDDDSEVREGKADIRYRASARQFLDLEYRFSRDALEQLNVFAAWPLSDRWTLNFTERYSLRDEENLETNVGVGYDACCWKVRGFFQTRVENTGNTRNAILFELELTGLTRIRAGF
ncbi:MAG: LPS assembly protein LptD, partial [Gammaproteobacteria bacterium]|nr:LPS assembly protein LptD [Gammaproteobacteria bacterium]